MLYIFLIKAPSLIFAEIFVRKDFTIRAAPGFMGPAKTCDKQFAGRRP